MKGVVSFYEKPGCEGNVIKKELIINKGYKLQVINLLEKEFDHVSLTCFFGGKPAKDCVNECAPAIQSGEISPSHLSEDELIEKMIETPILIKCPLIFYRGQFGCGWDSPIVSKLLGNTYTESGCLCNLQ